MLWISVLLCAIYRYQCIRESIENLFLRGRRPILCFWYSARRLYFEGIEFRLPSASFFLRLRVGAPESQALEPSVLCQHCWSPSWVTLEQSRIPTEEGTTSLQPEKIYILELQNCKLSNLNRRSKRGTRCLQVTTMNRNFWRRSGTQHFFHCMRICDVLINLCQ